VKAFRAYTVDNKIATVDCVDSWGGEDVETEIIIPFRQDKLLRFDEVGLYALCQL
jgi:hypothetical protein